MAVFRVERNKGYTVMSNHHLRNKELTLKAKGLLSQMLSLPEDWDYTLAGLSLINRESIDAIRTAVWELEKAGYITRRQGRDDKGKMTAIEYTIYEQPQPPAAASPEPKNPTLENPTTDKPILENPTPDKPTTENPTQLNQLHFFLNQILFFLCHIEFDLYRPFSATHALVAPFVSRVWDTSQQAILRGKIRKWVHTSYACYESFSYTTYNTEKRKNDGLLQKKNAAIPKKITTLSKSYSVLPDTSYLPSFSTLAISSAVALTIRMPVSLISSRSASSCRRLVSFPAGLSKRNWSTDIL